MLADSISEMDALHSDADVSKTKTPEMTMCSLGTIFVLTYEILCKLSLI